MVRLSRKEKQDKLELLASINQMNIGSTNNVEDNGKFCFHFIKKLNRVSRDCNTLDSLYLVNRH